MKITFSGVTGSRPLRLMEAQVWLAALNSMILESQRVVAEIRLASGNPKRKRRLPHEGEVAMGTA